MTGEMGCGYLDESIALRNVTLCLDRKPMCNLIIAKSITLGAFIVKLLHPLSRAKRWRESRRRC